MTSAMLGETFCVVGCWRCVLIVYHEKKVRRLTAIRAQMIFLAFREKRGKLYIFTNFVLYHLLFTKNISIENSSY